MSSLWSGRLALLANGLLALGVVWLLVRSAWLLIGGVAVESAPLPPVPAVPEARNGKGEFRWDLFGRSASAPAVARPVPVSDSDLRLRGVVAGVRGYAIISGSGSGEEVYRVGDELPGGGEVESIEPRQVIVLRNGRRETLSIDADALAAGRNGGSSGSGSRPSGTIRPQLPGVRGFSAPAGASIASLPDAARSMGIDAGELSGAISVMPVSGGGFRVRPGRNARLFGELGLQVNDVVTAVNGRPVESAGAVRELFSDVMSSGEVSITVRRDGREITLRPDLEQVMGSLQAQ